MQLSFVPPQSPSGANVDWLKLLWTTSSTLLYMPHALPHKNQEQWCQKSSFAHSGPPRQKHTPGGKKFGGPILDVPAVQNLPSKITGISTHMSLPQLTSFPLKRQMVAMHLCVDHGS